jgi:hypothetical protein
MSLSGVKRTWAGAVQMSAYDPKWTCCPWCLVRFWPLWTRFSASAALKVTQTTRNKPPLRSLPLRAKIGAQRHASSERRCHLCHDHDHGTLASNCLYSSGCRCLHAGCDAALRKRCSRCASRGLLPCPQQTAAQFRLRGCVQSRTGRECNNSRTVEKIFRRLISGIDRGHSVSNAPLVR